MMAAHGLMAMVREFISGIDTGNAIRHGVFVPAVAEHDPDTEDRHATVEGNITAGL